MVCPPGPSSTRMGSMSFFWASGISQVRDPRSSSASSLTNMSWGAKTVFSAVFSLKNAGRELPRHSSMSVSVAMEGEARFRSTWEMNPLLSSHRSASSSWVNPRCSRSWRSFSPISKPKPPPFFQAGAVYFH